MLSLFNQLQQLAEHGFPVDAVQDFVNRLQELGGQGNSVDSFMKSLKIQDTIGAVLPDYDYDANLITYMQEPGDAYPFISPPKFETYTYIDNDDNFNEIDFTQLQIKMHEREADAVFVHVPHEGIIYHFDDDLTSMQVDEPRAGHHAVNMEDGTNLDWLPADGHRVVDMEDNWLDEPRAGHHAVNMEDGSNLDWLPADGHRVVDIEDNWLDGPEFSSMQGPEFNPILFHDNHSHTDSMLLNDPRPREDMPLLRLRTDPNEQEVDADFIVMLDELPYDDVDVLLVSIEIKDVDVLDFFAMQEDIEEIVTRLYDDFTSMQEDRNDGGTHMLSYDTHDEEHYQDLFNYDFLDSDEVESMEEFGDDHYNQNYVPNYVPNAVLPQRHADYYNVNGLL